jgi:TonB family protein
MTRSSVTVVLTGAFLSVASVAAADDKPAPHGLGLLAGRVSDDAAREKLKAAMADPRPEVRAAAVRVINVSGVGALVPAVVAALATETDRAVASEMIRFLIALDRPELDKATLDAVRRLGGPVHVILADGLGRRANAAAQVPVLREVGVGDDAWRIFDRLAPEARGATGKAPARLAGVQTASGFPPGYVMDAVRASGCKLDGFGRILGGEVTYGVDGRPRHVALMRRDGSKECFEAVRSLLVSALAPLGFAAQPEQKTLQLLSDRPEFMQCMDEVAAQPPFEERRLDGGEGDQRDKIELPKKTRDLKPFYPEAVRIAGVQGVVILEGRIAPSGCVHHLALLFGMDTRLDLEAIRAVSGWAYSPPRLEGRPVPIIITITVNFKLSR